MGRRPERGAALPQTSVAPALRRLRMLAVHVHVHVKPGCEEAFREATIVNATHSLEEPGVVRFDVIQQADDPTRFVLVEVYRTPEDPGRHKQTDHYKKWRDTVADMMAEPRSNVKYHTIAPDDAGWETARS
jgi:quinol monooxygenase YgiN